MRNKVLEIRQEKGLTQEELSSLSGISRPTISKLENQEDVVVKTSTLLALSKALNKPLSEIFLI